MVSLLFFLESLLETGIFGCCFVASTFLFASEISVSVIIIVFFRIQNPDVCGTYCHYSVPLLVVLDWQVFFPDLAM